MKHLLFTLTLFLVTAHCSIGAPSYSETEWKQETETGILYGTLTIPKGKAPYPVLLFISGSGPTDRDGNNPVMKNNSLKMLSQQLAGKGIASLRYDKRGIAASANAMQAEELLLFDHYVDDAKGWMKQLGADSRFSKKGIIGHSEGSLIGMLAAETADFYISLAGAGRPIDIVLKEQLSAQPEELRNLSFRYIDSLKAGRRISDPDPRLMMLFRPSVQPYMISWFRHDPAQIIASLKIPVLIIQGTSDIQVSETDSRLLQSARPTASYLLIPQMNHVLKTIKGDREQNLSSYTDPEMPLSKPLVPGIVSFIKSAVKVSTSK